MGLLRRGVGTLVRVTIIIIMEICKAPTLRLKALNRHAHIMYIEWKMLSKKRKDIDKGF